jgi:hypothetical protein
MGSPSGGLAVTHTHHVYLSDFGHLLVLLSSYFTAAAAATLAPSVCVCSLLVFCLWRSGDRQTDRH